FLGFLGNSAALLLERRETDGLVYEFNGGVGVTERRFHHATGRRHDLGSDAVSSEHDNARRHDLSCGVARIIGKFAHGHRWIDACPPRLLPSFSRSMQTRGREP